MSSTIPGHTPKEPLTVATGGGGAWQPSSAPAHPTREGLRAAPSQSFYDSLEEESSQSLSDSLTCRKHSSAGASLRPRDSFSDSLKDSGDESDVSDTLDSDTCSFYSVQSHRHAEVSDSAASLLTSEFHSESTLYDSAPSIHTPLASSRSSFLSFDCSTRENSPATPRHRSSLSFQPGHPEQFDVRHGSESWEYTSCPDLTAAEHRQGRGLLQKPAVLCPAVTTQLNSLSLLKKRSLSGASSMSAVAGSTSPKPSDEGDKKKKGLMSSFRKSRKTGRKFRQQKKAAEGDVASMGSGTTIDGEQELLLDSDLSAPNSPLLLKSETVDVYQGDQKTEETEVALDSHQTTHERLNGSASPKGSSSPKGSTGSSKNSSPVLAKSGKTDAPKETEEQEEKKKEKSKFGGLLMRKDKKHKAESASKSSSINNVSVSPVTADDSTVSGNAVAASDSSEVASVEKREGGKGDSDPTTAAAGTDSMEQQHSTPRSTSASYSPSYRSYISNVQFVKNYTVSAEKPQVRSPKEADPKVHVNAPEVDVPDAKMPPEETTSTVETKRTTTVSSNGKPTTTEVTSKLRTTVTIVSKQKGSPKVSGSASPAATVRRIKAEASKSPPYVRAAAASPSSTRSRSPTPVLLPKRLSLENVAKPSKLPSSAAERTPLLTVTLPADEVDGEQKVSEGIVHGIQAAPVRATPPSSPEGYGRDARETPEGDRSVGECDLLNSSGLTNDSWV